MNAPHHEFVVVGRVSDVPRGGARAFAVGNYDVAVFNVNGELYALENCCPHQGSPIADGQLEANMVTCPWHAWRFDVRTGKMTLGDFAFIPRFAVHIDGDLLALSKEPLV